MNAEDIFHGRLKNATIVKTIMLIETQLNNLKPQVTWKKASTCLGFNFLFTIYWAR